MTHVQAAEGGYQTFYLHGGEWAILLGSVWPPLATPPLMLADLLAGYLLWVARLCS